MIEAVAKAADAPAAAVASRGDARRRRFRASRRSAMRDGVEGSAASGRAAASDHADAGPDRRRRGPARSSGSVTRASEWKLDGARIQAHRAVTTMRASSRATSPTSPSGRPEIVESASERWTSRRSCSTARRSRSAADGRPGAVSGDDEPLRDEGRHTAAERHERRCSRILLRLSPRRR